MKTIVRIERLVCQDPQDSDADEVMMQQDGRQVWPRSGWFTMARAQVVDMQLDLQFEGASTRIVLLDQEDFGSDDFLGEITIPASGVGHNYTRPIVGNGCLYTLNFTVLAEVWSVIIEKVLCVEPQEDSGDELVIRQDNRQVWPPGDGFSMSRGQEVQVRLDLPFRGNSTTISLWDLDPIGTDDSFGQVEIGFPLFNSGPHSFDIVGNGAHYVLTCTVGRR